MRRREAHESHEGIIHHIVGEWHISSVPHGSHLTSMGALIVIRRVNPEGNVYHGVVELVRIVPRTLGHLFAVVREIEHAISLQIIHRLIHDAFDDIVIEEDGVVILIIHHFRCGAVLAHVTRPVVELGGIAVPVAHVAAHEMHHHQLAAILRVHAAQVRHQHAVVILGNYVGADVLIDPILVIASAADGADGRVPHAVAGLVRNPSGAEACLASEVNDGVRVHQVHVIVLVLLRERLGQDLHGLGVARVSMIEENIIRIRCRRRLERRGVSVITIDAHVVAVQRLAHDEHIKTIRCIPERLGHRFIFDVHAPALLHHSLEIRKAVQRLIGFIIHMGQPGGADGKTAKPHIYAEEERHDPPGRPRYRQRPMEAEAAGVEDEPGKNQKRQSAGHELGVRNIHLDILHGLRHIRLRQRQKHIDGNQGVGDKIIAHVGELDAHIEEHQDHAGNTGNHPPFPRENPRRGETGNEKINRRGQLAGYIRHVQHHIRLHREVGHNQ